MLTSGEYNLIEKNEIQNEKSMLFVKLTDSALKALIDFLKHQDKLIVAPSIEFNGNNGFIHIPTSPNGFSKSDKSKEQFKFDVLSNVAMQGQQGRFDCVQHKHKSKRLIRIGQLTRKIRIHANEDVFETTKNRITAIDLEQKKNCAVEIDWNTATNRKVKVEKKDVENSVENRIMKNVNSLINKNKSRSITLSKSCNPTIMRRSLRDRIIHMLAVRPLKKLEISTTLRKDGLRDSDKSHLMHTLASVSTVRDNVYHLCRHVWTDIKEDWPFYSEQERTQMRRNRPQNLTPPRSDQSSNYTAPTEDKSSSCQYKRPGYVSGVDGLLTKRHRISHFIKPSTKSVSVANEENVRQISPNRSTNCVDEVIENSEVVLKNAAENSSRRIKSRHNLKIKTEPKSDIFAEITRAENNIGSRINSSKCRTEVHRILPNRNGFDEVYENADLKNSLMRINSLHNAKITAESKSNRFTESTRTENNIKDQMNLSKCSKDVRQISPKNRACFDENEAFKKSGLCNVAAENSPLRVDSLHGAKVKTESTRTENIISDLMNLSKCSKDVRQISPNNRGCFEENEANEKSGLFNVAAKNLPLRVNGATTRTENNISDRINLSKCSKDVRQISPNNRTRFDENEVNINSGLFNVAAKNLPPVVHSLDSAKVKAKSTKTENNIGDRINLSKCAKDVLRIPPNSNNNCFEDANEKFTLPNAAAECTPLLINSMPSSQIKAESIWDTFAEMTRTENNNGNNISDQINSSKCSIDKSYESITAMNISPARNNFVMMNISPARNNSPIMSPLPLQMSKMHLPNDSFSFDEMKNSTDVPDYARVYVTITCTEQRRKYKNDFETIFEKYKQINDEILSITSPFLKLRELSTKNSAEHQRINAEIGSAYAEIKTKFLDKKKIFVYLDKMLSHIKKLVQEYDDKVMNS